MGSNGVVSIRVEALGVLITIADGSIAIEQTKTELAVSKVRSGLPPNTRFPRVPTTAQGILGWGKFRTWALPGFPGRKAEGL
jgi:hypothetical protein